MKRQHCYCPLCFSSDLKVISTTRQADDQIIRRRACLEPDCLHRWYTLQQPEEPISRDRLLHTRGFGYQLLQEVTA